MSGNLARARARSAPIGAWQLEIAEALLEPLLDRLGPRWIPEADATKGLWDPSLRLFWAEQFGLIERRRGGWPWARQSMIRLSRKGLALC